MTTTDPLTLFGGLTGNLNTRSQIVVSGPDAESFLQSILTADLISLPKNTLRPAALLSPQGKIQFDMLVSRLDDAPNANGDATGDEAKSGGFRLDIDAELAPSFIKRLMLYRLRAKAEIVQLNESVIRIGCKIDSSLHPDSHNVRDERFPEQAQVQRLYSHNSQQPVITAEQLENWTALRVYYGIAEGGSDYAMNDVFPHDVNFDQLQGVSFKKGCYVGQEVVSRMQHRGTARRRILLVSTLLPDVTLPASETALSADGKDLGTLRSVAGSKALALVRIDRVKEAMDKQLPIMAGMVEVKLDIPAYAHFTFPEAAQ